MSGVPSRAAERYTRSTPGADGLTMRRSPHSATLAAKSPRLAQAFRWAYCQSSTTNMADRAIGKTTDSLAQSRDSQFSEGLAPIDRIANQLRSRLATMNSTRLRVTAAKATTG